MRVARMTAMDQSDYFGFFEMALLFLAYPIHDFLLP
jgi:hypothetical protein